MIMRIMRWIIASITALTTIAFVIVVVITAITSDKTIPVIEIDSEELVVSVNATDEELLQGVTAYDEKDGDISDSLMVESISKFTEIGQCKITYVVCDSDNHVTTESRALKYTDYEAPKFKMTKSLIYSADETFDIYGVVGAEDCLDGDISQNVIVYSPDFEEGEVGNYTLQATVTNSKGDSSTIELPLIVENMSENVKVILKEYLIYRKAGDPVPNWNDYIYETVDSTGTDAQLNLVVKTAFDNNKPGTYVVNYYGTDKKEATGHTALIVVVE